MVLTPIEQIVRDLAKVEPIAQYPPGFWPTCFFCGAEAKASPTDAFDPTTIEHADDCVWVRAKTIADAKAATDPAAWADPQPLIEVPRDFDSVPEKCPDKGTCHHNCGDGPCFRVRAAWPLSDVFPNDKWPAEVVAEAEAKAP